MRGSSSRLLPLAALLLVGRVAGDVEPPGAVMERLASEAYPERVTAEADLTRWAVAGGQPAMVSLAHRLDGLKDPEVRQRVFSALRTAVIDDLAGKRPGFVGVQMASVRIDDEGKLIRGVEIVSVVKDSPAASAGLQEYSDVLIALDGIPWESPEPHHEFARKVGKLGPGAKARFTVWREGAIREVVVELAPRPWSAGEYREDAGRLVREAGPIYRTEHEAEEAIFREWLSTHRPPGKADR